VSACAYCTQGLLYSQPQRNALVILAIPIPFLTDLQDPSFSGVAAGQGQIMNVRATSVQQGS